MIEPSSTESPITVTGPCGPTDGWNISFASTASAVPADPTRPASAVDAIETAIAIRRQVASGRRDERDLE